MSDENVIFHGRLAVQQRVLPAYRAPFFETLAGSCEGGLSVFAGQPLPGEGIVPVEKLDKAVLFMGRNRHYFDITSPFYQCWQEGLLVWLERWQPDALIVEANLRYLNTRRAVSWMHARGRPVLGWGLGAPPLKGLLGGVRRGSRMRFLSMLDGLIAYSQRGAQEYQALGFPPERVFTAPNAAAAKPTRPPPERPDGFTERPVVLFVGRLQQRKRLDLLLEACASLPADKRPRLWIVGEGPAQAELQALAARAYPEAEFLGSKFGVELERCFEKADLFVLPGTGGLAVQQAMSFGLPVIVGEGDGTQDDLVRPENGWRLPADEPAALQAALNAALSDALADPPRLRRMGAASYRIVSQEVNLEKMAAAFVEALNQVAGAVLPGG